MDSVRVPNYILIGSIDFSFLRRKNQTCHVEKDKESVGKGWIWFILEFWSSKELKDSKCFLITIYMFMLSLPLIKSGCSEKHLSEISSSLYSSALTRLKTEEMRWRRVCVCWEEGTSLLSVPCSSWISELKQWLYLFKGTRSFISPKCCFAQCFAIMSMSWMILCLCPLWPASPCHTNTHIYIHRDWNTCFIQWETVQLQKETRASLCIHI